MRYYWYIDTFTHRSFYTQKLLRTEAFTHRSFYTQKLIHTEAFTHRSFYTQKLLHTEAFTLKAFTRRSFYTQKLLQTDAFTHRSCYTRKLLHTEPFTHKRINTEKLFTHRSFYTEKLFTHRSFYTQTLLHTEAAHQTPLGPPLYGRRACRRQLNNFLSQKAQQALCDFPFSHNLDQVQLHSQEGHEEAPSGNVARGSKSQHQAKTHSAEEGDALTLTWFLPCSWNFHHVSMSMQSLAQKKTSV